MKKKSVLNKFNRGEIDVLAMNRDDVERINNSSETMENFMPVRLGPMTFRPGTERLNFLGAGSQDYTLIPFVASSEEAYVIAVSSTGFIRIFRDSAPINYTASSYSLTNEQFATDLSGWTTITDTGASATHATGIDTDYGGNPSGAVKLVGTGTGRAAIWQTMSKGAGFDITPYIAVSVYRGPVTIKIGTTGADSTDLYEGTLPPGFHNLKILTGDAANVTVTFENSKDTAAYVGQCIIESDTSASLFFDGGAVSSILPDTFSPHKLRYTQSADVLFVAGDGIKPFKFERRGPTSWSLSEYRVDDGPFGLVNNTDVTMTPAQLEGDTTLTASRDYFSDSNVGQLFKVTSAGQNVTANVSSDNAGTGNIRVIGVGSTRQFTITRSGSWVGRVTLQRSEDEATWQDIESYTSNLSKTYNDNLSNQELYYRLWVKTGDYTSGTIGLDLVYTAGSIDGICRVTEVTSSTVAQVQVLSDFGDTEATRDWYPGEWKDGAYPTSVSLYEGRLWWAGATKLWGSVSDEFASMDTTIEGDSAAIRRTIGFGPVDEVEWIGPGARMILGLASDEITVRSSAFGEVMTSKNTNLKSGSNQGVAPVNPVRVDSDIYYVHRSGDKVMRSAYSVDTDGNTSTDIMSLCPNICKGGISGIAIARHPETRLYVVMNDGTMRVFLFDKAEDIKGWSRVKTIEGDRFKDVCVLPTSAGDEVYVVVARYDSVAATDRYYLERFKPVDESLTYHYDHFIEADNPGASVGGFFYMIGREFHIWADGKFVGTHTITAGSSVPLPSSDYQHVVVGLPYTAEYKSNRLSGYVDYSVHGSRKRIVDYSLSAKDYEYGALKHGPDFDTLENVPQVEFGKQVATGDVVDWCDESPMSFNGDNQYDPRLCLKATGPCTILSITYGVLQDGEA